jgi:hypothetical protein
LRVRPQALFAGAEKTASVDWTRLVR